MSKTNKINEELQKAGLLDKVKAILVKFTETPAPVAMAPATPPVVEEPKKNEIKLADGTSIIVEGEEIKEGAKVSKVTPEGSADVLDGDYEEAETKTVYTVMGGVITAIKKADPVTPPATPPNEMPAMMATMQETINALTSKVDAVVLENSALKTKLSEQENTVKVAFEVIETISKMPADEPIESPKKWDEMTALEKRRATKDK